VAPLEARPAKRYPPILKSAAGYESPPWGSARGGPQLRARRAPRSRRTGRARPHGRDGHDKAACATSRGEFRLFVLLGSSSPALCVALVQCRRCPGSPPIHVLESVCPATTCRCCSRGVSYLRSQPRGSRRRSMHDRAFKLLRIPLPRRWVNRPLAHPSVRLTSCSRKE